MVYDMDTGQNDIIGLVDGSGNVVVRYSYDGWGKPISMPASDAGSLYSTLGVRNPFRYRGYYYDAETSLYYVKSRYYEPEIGRWINADTIMGQVGNNQSYNLYIYCFNNVTNRMDNDGCFPTSTILSGLGNVSTGLGAIVVGLAVVTCGVATPIMLGVAALTIGAGLLTATNGISDLGEGFFGKNIIKDKLFRGNTEVYNIYSSVTAITATVGTAICGGWMVKNVPRISAYNNVQKYKYTKTISDEAHMKRPYSNSILTQKQIIKYGKMTKDHYGYIFSIEGAVNNRTALWRLGVNNKLALIWHFGHGF